LPKLRVCSPLRLRIADGFARSHFHAFILVSTIHGMTTKMDREFGATATNWGLVGREDG
jgi:hypothetical protein